jgi:hypothetical protein
MLEFIGMKGAGKSSTGGDPFMSLLASKTRPAASESQKNLVLVICILVMSVLCVGVIWQAQIIANQREDIKWLQELKFGG